MHYVRTWPMPMLNTNGCRREKEGSGSEQREGKGRQPKQAATREQQQPSRSPEAGRQVMWHPPTHSTHLAAVTAGVELAAIRESARVVNGHLAGAKYTSGQA